MKTLTTEARSAEKAGSLFNMSDYIIQHKTLTGRHATATRKTIIHLDASAYRNKSCNL